ncbi:MAG: hypothetical protein OEY00_10425 [Gammaproteobacteria bacterium]|nr:hypothetical protein [Gammaproteobacteria bacterium]
MKTLIDNIFPRQLVPDVALDNCSVFVPDVTLPIPSMESSCIVLPSPIHGLVLIPSMESSP